MIGIFNFQNWKLKLKICFNYLFHKLLLQKLDNGAKLIWTSTTPITVQNDTQTIDLEKNSKVLRRNALAEEIMQEYHIPISDLYQLVLNKVELRGADGYHYNADGQRVQGEAISELLLQFLK